MSRAVLASANGFKDMADGTLRLTIDVEPSDAQAALALFGRRGTPVALARITNEAAVAHDQGRQGGPQAPADPLPPQKLPPALSSTVAMTCAERSFADFLLAFDLDGFRAVRSSGCREPVAQWVRDYCDVSSRADIQPGTAAADRWNGLAATYEHWQRTGEAA